MDLLKDGIKFSYVDDHAARGFEVEPDFRIGADLFRRVQGEALLVGVGRFDVGEEHPVEPGANHLLPGLGREEVVPDEVLERLVDGVLRVAECGDRDALRIGGLGEGLSPLDSVEEALGVPVGNGVDAFVVVGDFDFRFEDRDISGGFVGDLLEGAETN